MRFIHFDAPGGPEVLRLSEGPRPVPAASEVLIRVEAAGLNRPDLVQRKGFYPPPLGASPVLGLEVAGSIVECGAEVQDWRPGDRVCALVAGGGYAEYCVAPAVQCLPIPKGMPVEEAAALPETFFTVWTNVFKRGRLREGETLLIHGGSSGIGTTAIQLARAFGARVFVTAGSEEKCDACRKLGAEGAVNYRTSDFVVEVRRMNDGRGVDVILDMVAGDYFQKNLELLAQDGRLAHIAFQKGEQVALSIRTLMAKGATITGSMLRPRSVAEKGSIAAELREKVWPLLESRQIQVVMDRIFPFDEVVDAHRLLESGENIGKVVLRM